MRTQAGVTGEDGAQEQPKEESEPRGPGRSIPGKAQAIHRVFAGAMLGSCADS